MKGAERRIYFFDVEVSTNKKHATPPPITAVIAALQARLEERKASLEISNETATLEIGDMRVDEKRHLVTILVRISDTTAPDAYLSDPSKGTSRIVRKEEGEGRGFGAHLTISLSEEPDKPNTYLALLEKNTGLHRSHVVRLLQAVLLNLYRENKNSFTCDHAGGQRDRDGNPKQVCFRPMLQFLGHPSDSLIQDLERGRLQELVLIHNEQQTQLGGRPWLEKQERSLRVKAKLDDPIQNLWDQLKAAMSEQATDGYEKARVKFTTPAGEIATVEIDTATGYTLEDDRYVKSGRISGINPPLDESSDAIVEHFASELEDLLVAARDGDA